MKFYGGDESKAGGSSTENSRGVDSGVGDCDYAVRSGGGVVTAVEAGGSGAYNSGDVTGEGCNFCSVLAVRWRQDIAAPITVAVLMVGRGDAPTFARDIISTKSTLPTRAILCYM